MKLLNNINGDYIILGLSAVIISTFSILLYLDFTRKIDSGDAKKIGTITYKIKVAERKYSTQVVWEDIEQNSLVYNNDSIRTSDISAATIKLLDGTNINLDENSMILLSMASNAININFSHGSISANRGTVVDGSVQQLNIKSKDATVSIDKSDIKLSKAENKELNLTVLDGDARVQTGKVEKTVNKDQKVIITKDLDAKVYKLNLKLSSPAPNNFYITAKEKAGVNFTWEPVEKKSTIFFEISKESSFNKKIVNKKVISNSIAETLAEGNYYWRIRALEQGTGMEEISDTWKLIIIHDKAVQLTSPQNNDVITYNVKAPIINFRWTKNDIASSYEIEISKDPSFKNIMKSIETPQTGIAVDTLEMGGYYWRVKTKVNINPGYNGFSQVYRLNVDKKNAIKQPLLISPPDDNKISMLMLEGKELIFSWDSDAQVKKYELHIARDEKFKNLILNTAVNGNFISIKNKFSAGNYYWRVRASGQSTEESIYSVLRRFSVIETKPIKLIAPKNNSVFHISENEKLSSIIFSWDFPENQADIKGKFLFELSNDKNFVALYYKNIVDVNSVKIDKIGSGLYYWRVKLLDKDKNLIMTSDPYTIDVEKKIITELVINSPYKKSAIYVNAKLIGYNTVTLKPAPGEKQTVEVVVDGYEKYKEEVVLKSGEKKRIQVHFDKGAVLTVISPVKNSKIYVNSKYIGNDKISIRQDAGRKLYIEVRSKGFKNFNTSLILTAGESKEVRAIMESEIAKRVKWKEKISSAGIAKPVYYKNYLVVATDDGFLTAMNKEGQKVWKTNIERGVESTPVVSSGTVYVMPNNGVFHSININNGKINWKKKLFGSLIFGSKPIIVGNKIYIATSYGRIYAFFTDGKELWQRDLESGIYSSPAYKDEVLYVGAEDQHIYAISATDGGIEWKFKTDGRIVSSTPIILDKTLFIGCYSGMFFAINIKKGKLEWKYKTGDSILSSPVIFKGIVLFGSNDGYLYSFSAKDGKLLWKFRAGYKITTKPIISKGRVFMTSGSNIFALNISSGVKDWEHTFEKKIKTAPTIVGNDIYLGLENGEIASVRIDLVQVYR